MKSKRKWISTIVAAAGMGLAASGRADTIYLQGLTLDGIVIQNVANGQISFESAGGNVSKRDIARVQRIHVDEEAGLNAAEDAMAAKDYASAIDGYLKATRSPAHPWVKAYAAGRLIDVAGKSNRFDAAVTGYITLLQLDAASASRVRPQIPEGVSTYIDTAISQINEALSTAGLTDDKKIVLLQFLVDLFNAKKDARDSDQAASQLDDLLAKDPNNPNAARANARRKLQSANQDLDAKKFQDALAVIDSARAIFVDPAQQADAFFAIARAREGLAAGTADSNAWKDVALCYMRIVADFKDAPGKPHVADALLKTAQIEEQLNDPDASVKLYQQLVVQFPGDPAADTARQSLAKVKPKA